MMERLGRISGRWVVIAALLAAASVGMVLTVNLAADSRLQQGGALALALGLFSLGAFTDRVFGRSASQRQRLALADDIIAEGETRFGPEPVVCRLLARLRDYYRAEVCVFVLTQPRQPPRLFCIEAGSEQAVEFPPEDTGQLLSPLLAVPAGRGMIFREHAGGFHWGEASECLLYGEGYQRPTPQDRENAAAIAAALDSSSFISIPLPREIRTGGRLFVGARGRPFGDRDMEVLQPVVDQVSLLLENACLLAMLAAEAAEHERQRLARDLHDSAVQPYIGLKFGLEALARKTRDDPALSEDIRRLIERTASEIADMRQLIGGLHSGDGSSQAPLLSSLRRQTTRFSELFGIDVEIGAEGELRMSRSLAREVLHMVSEGLSNICRHTRATRAMVWLRRQADGLELQIANDHDPGGGAPHSFMPVSLNERAAALGGSVAVDPGDFGKCTTVTVRIPLAEQGATP